MVYQLDLDHLVNNLRRRYIRAQDDSNEKLEYAGYRAAVEDAGVSENVIALMERVVDSERMHAALAGTPDTILDSKQQAELDQLMIDIAIEQASYEAALRDADELCRLQSLTDTAGAPDSL